MNDPAYSAARAVASKVHEHFAHHAQTSAAGAARTSAGVGPDVIEAVIDAAFWASLRREEHYVPRVSIAIMAPEDAVQPLVFEHPLSLNAGSLVHVSAAVERPGLHLAVWRFGEQHLVLCRRSRGARSSRHQASAQRPVRQVREPCGARRRSNQDHR